MGLDRRAFLKLLGTLPIAATLDLEKLLWIPGQMVVVPSTYEVHRITLDEINAATLRQLAPAINEFFKASPFLAMLKAKGHFRLDGHTIEMPIIYRPLPVDQG
jgi:hypothetical protein